jgi:hydrogenase nickel incorporation protein HypB
MSVKNIVLDTNSTKAKRIYKTLTNHGITSFNITASPGAGKTSILEKTILALRDKRNIAVIEGDIVPIDVERLNKLGIPVVLANTAGACHLDSTMLEQALHKLPLASIDLLFVENVGNLICPAHFPLGTSYTVTIASVPEGDDKPDKYPLLFSSANIILLNKIDLIPYCSFDISTFTESVKRINPASKIMPVSARSGEGLDQFIGFIQTLPSVQ